MLLSCGQSVVGYWFSYRLTVWVGQLLEFNPSWKSAWRCQSDRATRTNYMYVHCFWNSCNSEINSALLHCGVGLNLKTSHNRVIADIYLSHADDLKWRKWQIYMTWPKGMTIILRSILAQNPLPTYSTCYFLETCLLDLIIHNTQEVSKNYEILVLIFINIIYMTCLCKNKRQGFSEAVVVINYME